MARSFTWGRQLGKGGFGNVSVLLACFSSLVVEERGSKDLDLSRPKTKKNVFKKKKLFQFQVRVVIDKRNGTEFACKSIPKRLDAPGLAPERQAAHVDNIRREVAVLRRLRGTLNVVALEGAFEDADSAHIVMVRRAFV